MSTAKKVRKSLLLAVLFAVGFSVPLLLLSKYLFNGGVNPTIAKQEADSDDSKDLVFPDAIRISREGRFLKVAHSPDFVPSHNEDFLLLFWAKLRVLPKAGERLVLFSKYDGSPPKIKGYAVGIRSDSNSIRPVLYWGNGTKSSRWYDFPEVSISVGEWNLFAVNVHKGRFVGMHFGKLTNELVPQLRFLGGHELELEEPLDVGEAEILYGAPPGRDFRGRLGPLAIFNPLKIKTEKLGLLLEDYLKDPQNLSIVSDNADVKLAIIDGRTDSSGTNNSVTWTAAR